MNKKVSGVVVVLLVMTFWGMVHAAVFLKPDKVPEGKEKPKKHQLHADMKADTAKCKDCHLPQYESRELVKWIGDCTQCHKSFKKAGENIISTVGPPVNGAVSLVVANSNTRTKKKNAATSAEEVASVATTPEIKTTSNSIGMSFVKVPAGTFTMGSPTGKTSINCPPDDPFTTRNEFKDCKKMAQKKAEASDPPVNETPAHRVTISNNYLIGKFEVTQAQWFAVMGNNPSKFKTDKVKEDSRNFPVEQVTWDEVQNFIKKLSAKEGKNYRLPTEAEWEYACRSAGINQKYCGSDSIDTVGWYWGNGARSTRRVGTKPPNGLGIYDMSGNVKEMVSDFYEWNYYSNSPSIDPKGPDGRVNVIRGGSWDGHEGYATSTFREGISAQDKGPAVGFRLILDSNETP